MLNCVMPTWRQIFCKEDNNPDRFWNLENCIYTSSSAASMRMIFDSCIEQQEKNITVLVPAYFCQETLNDAYTDRVRYLYYPICQDLNPDWKEVKALCAKEHIDVMIFCHYFGMYRDVDRTKNFCMQKKIVLIEDCAHVLYPGKDLDRKEILYFTVRIRHYRCQMEGSFGLIEARTKGLAVCRMRLGDQQNLQSGRKLINGE